MVMSPYVRRLRDAVGHARLFVPSVAGLVRARDGGLLLVRSRDDGSWTTPGGAIELDETPATAVVREVWEETGLLVKPTRVFAVHGGPAFVVRYPNGDETQYLSTMFECEIAGGELRADGEETTDAAFLTLREAASRPLQPWLVSVLPRLYEATATPWFEPPSWRPEET